MTERRLTTAQALVEFLAVQRVERDGRAAPLFAGVLGIFGHGNVAGIGQALQQHGGLRYVLPRNEQAMVHTAAAYAKHMNRLQTWACTSSIGPGATNMVTGAALATINRLPVLLLPGDIFATRRVDPALQQLELPGRPDISVNDAFRPVSRFFDRIDRPEQLAASMLEAVRVLTDQAETGAVTIALPQDVQAEAWSFPEQLFARRTWRIGRPIPDAADLDRVAAIIRTAERPLIVAGGGVLYADATIALRASWTRPGSRSPKPRRARERCPTTIPRARRDRVDRHPGCQSGSTRRRRRARYRDAIRRLHDGVAHGVSGSRRDHALNVGVVRRAQARARFRWSATHERGSTRCAIGSRGHRVPPAVTERSARFNREWDEEVERLTVAAGGDRPTQAQVLGAVNDSLDPRDVVVCAAGSMPGDLHKIWRTRDAKGYHVEYGYSCMGYEVAGGLGVKMADPGREVVVMVGDGSWLMMSSEVVTSIQEGVRLTVVLIDNHGFGSIAGLSRSLGSDGFGTAYDTEVDLTANACSLGAVGVHVDTVDELSAALREARTAERTTVIVVECDPTRGVGPYESWWDVPVAEVSTMPSVQQARAEAEAKRATARPFLGGDRGE